MTLTTDRFNEIYENPEQCSYSEIQEMAAMLANREAQPVGKAEITKIAAELVRGDYLSKLWTEAEKSRHVDTHRLQNLLDELHDMMKVKAIAITRMLTAPPAPSVPDDYQHLKNVRELYHKQEERLFALAQRIKGASFDKYSHTTAQAIDVLEREIFGEDGDTCRAAMLAQPVSSSYRLNSPVIPDGWKLVPIDATRAMIDAAQRVEEDGYDAMHKAMLAAAPESGNDHDTRR
ncbi:TPA: hypothetical protein ACGD8A_001155 [Serratia marcescens]|uniref:Uncharacterized protein n=1 Tax=Serratia marcescens SM39 TaxID=1334564 RepID=A0AAT9DXU7_SERMA|nr:hypothetical protein [Serratia marcescens]BAO32584.1 hypothetical protein SM39_0522 [Serratia marcescens SM39]BCZ39788.1 hypothetical protein SMGES_11140 [Serratia marcescens]HBI6266475.1 hypothetical protein [Serratia marcescens]HBI6947636.1 hypothetical protein [Serratia marcescens]